MFLVCSQLSMLRVSSFLFRYLVYRLQLLNVAYNKLINKYTLHQYTNHPIDFRWWHTFVSWTDELLFYILMKITSNQLTHPSSWWRRHHDWSFQQLRNWKKQLDSVPKEQFFYKKKNKKKHQSHTKNTCLLPVLNVAHPTLPSNNVGYNCAMLRRTNISISVSYTYMPITIEDTPTADKPMTHISHANDFGSINTLWHSNAISTEICVNTGTGPRNGLLPDGTRSLPEPVLIYNQQDPLTFILW